MSDKFGFKPEYMPSAPVQPPNYSDPNNSQGMHPHLQPPPSNFPPHFDPPHQAGPPPPPPHFGRPPPHFGPSPPSFGPPHHSHPLHHRPHFNPPYFPHSGHQRPWPPQQHPTPYPSDPSNTCCPPNYPLPPCPPDGTSVVKGYYWVATNTRQGVPPSAVRGGVDQDGTTIYVGRAHHEGDWIPAKVIPEKDVAYVAYGGKEHAKSEFQVLCEQTFDWVNTSGSNIPPEAVVGGQTSDGEPLYVGRVQHAGSYTVGKVQPSHGTCYIPFGGEELGFQDYEVLVLRG